MPGPVKAAVVEEYIPNQSYHKPHSPSSSSLWHPKSLGQIATSCLEISFGAMPVSYETKSATKDPNFDSHEYLAKLAHIVLRARIPSEHLHNQPLVTTNLVDAWTSGWPVHIDIYKEDTLLERWITSLDTSSSSHHGTRQDFILMLQSVYAHTRLMPIHPLLSSKTLLKDQLSFNVSSSDTPCNSPTLNPPPPPNERREFKSDAQLKVFQFQKVHMTPLGIIQLEVVFDENVGDQKSMNAIQQRIESLHLTHTPLAPSPPSSSNKSSSVEQTDESSMQDYFGIPIPDTSSKRKATSPFPSPGQSQRMMHRSLHRHAASQLARQHKKPVVQLTFSPPLQQQQQETERSPSPASSNLASLFSSQSSDAPPLVHPLQPHGSAICSPAPDISMSPPSFMIPMAQPSIAKRRLSRLSLSAMEQEDLVEEVEEDDNINIPLATSPSMQYTHQGRTVAYSTSPSSQHHYHTADDLVHHKHLHAHRRSSLVHASPTFIHRRNSLGLPHGELFGSLVGSYEESILNGRMSTLPSKPITFHAQIGVLAHGPCKQSLRCPPHATLVFPSFFYELEDSDLPTPYVGTIDLEGGLTGDRFKRKPGHYRLPAKGQLQIVIKNPNKTAVKLFLIPYDLGDMPAGTKTFLRQKSFGLSGDGKATLRYAIHVQVCCSEKNHVYLFKHIRVVFANRATNEKLRVVCEDPGVPKYVPLTELCTKR
jgi:hypothetical protein